ncbi:MAG: molybdenum cofactor guanylyltransferase [Prosthecobacter sp.]|nr:molybdenum cofactor guanylyltransferase [Prosthecobacter sp.]
MPPLAAVLLAGGQSTRMGRDKAMLDWQGRPLWQHQLSTLAALCPTRLLVACREEQGLHQQPCAQVVDGWYFDPPGDPHGPMGAIHRVLRASAGPLLVLAVDMPQMEPTWLLDQTMPSAMKSKGCFFQTGHGIEPLSALYHPAMLPYFDQHLAKGRLALRELAAECVSAGLADLIMASEAEESLFRNINSPKDL